VAIKLVVLVAVFLAVALVYVAWRRPPRMRGRRLDLADLGVRGPAIIQFTTRYCALCRAAAPKLHEAAVNEAVAYAHVDVGERPEVARAYGIRTVPTIAVAGADGRVHGVWTGLPADGEVADAARRARKALRSR
jgi:thiol-disulfide isomerase/thioredoxin